MKKKKSVSLESILNIYSKDKEFCLRYDEHRFYLQVAHLIRDLRDKSGFSQAELAKRAKLSQPQIARIEKGDSKRTPTFDTIYKILKVLGHDLELRAIPLHEAA